MSEFKFVQWGKGTPVDYQRLNAMMLNEQYLKDAADRTPKGVLLWKSVPSFTLDPTGGYNPIVSLSNLLFDVEEERLVSITFYPGTISGISPAGAADISFGFLLDDAVSPVKFAGGYWVFDGRGPSTTVSYVTPVALSKGSHTVSVIMRGNGDITTASIGTGGSDPLIIIRDEGKFISASS
jgi:hypothetical protein